MKAVVYRDFQNSDQEALVEILRAQWHAHYTDTTIGSLEATGDLAHFLGKATFTCVAELHGEACGIIAARIGKASQQTQKYWQGVYEKAMSDLQFQDTGAHAHGLQYFDAEQRVNRQLLERSGMSGSAEVVLLAVSPAARGYGVGRALIDAARAYLASQQALPAYLFTDTSCTWEFYEHLGFIREAQYVTSLEERQVLPEEMYLYRIE
ncbi:GNAT family N-acetyltransferase [Collinsella sp. zg1085]|uniref:GNAT family N-acetyltransferase n=1 Tax=Collinsella sp. zg1085 TaxID=2844380 RepID=UPI001C0DC019|nr:GNAT family N-acetyltransferase [Collinsella sp. zg1085]QWT17840.1 GNAT family N-acetyltransferase [Collinsella sp. zg1085]